MKLSTIINNYMPGAGQTAPSGATVDLAAVDALLASLVKQFLPQVAHTRIDNQNGDQSGAGANSATSNNQGGAGADSTTSSNQGGAGAGSATSNSSAPAQGADGLVQQNVATAMNNFNKVDPVRFNAFMSKLDSGGNGNGALQALIDSLKDGKLQPGDAAAIAGQLQGNAVEHGGGKLDEGLVAKFNDLVGANVL